VGPRAGLDDFGEGKNILSVPEFELRIVQPVLYIKIELYIYIYIYIYTGCPRRNVPDFGRVFLMLKYTDITQNTYV